MQSTPPGAIVRNLTFQSENLGRDTTILLVFDTDMEGLYDTIYPVVWKTFTFPKTDWYSYNVTYSDDLGFSKVRIGNRNLLDTLGHFKLKPGQKTTLSLNDDDDLRFSLPVNGTNDYLTAENETGFHQDLAVGFYDPSRTFTYGPAPMLFFKEVGNGSKATAQCKPVLRIYVESDYRETEVLVDAIKSTAILEQDLHQLFRNTVFNLERNMLTGRYKLTKTKP
ncbi:uncharacterized protein HD556DRAFT_1442681 [Suillus plorans]|uniref:Uncharacterized protein n=1 Tax=Suillus plorans TaxID=116603 RepID=A0A9P7ARA4_9AGAM|nr:uncharacterized protein HD556DRAFT_1442681 [Suillus plorans]KAG1794894.1 hypothetical protein HD556DRAFT_1442681 [Suillus plorans]